MNPTVPLLHAGPSRRRANGRLGAEIRAALRQADKPGEAAERLSGRLASSIGVRPLTRTNVEREPVRTPCSRAHSPVTREAGFTAGRVRGLLEERADHEAIASRFVDGPTDADDDLLRRLPGSDAAPDR